jgi:hypothetical protein
MTDDELDAGAGKAVRDRDALPRVRGVVADGHRDLLPENAARRVDIGDRLLGAVLELRAEGCILTGEGTGKAEPDLPLRGSLSLRA